MTLTTANFQEWDKKKIELLKNTICRGASDNEFELFLHACKRSGLDPFMNQIHSVPRPVYNPKTDKSEWTRTIQTGIDGYRLIAERSGKYSPGRTPSYTYDNEGNIISSTAYVKKLTKDGTWHEISAEAFYSEYVAITKKGEPNSIWKSKPHIMLAKCAEALALRKAFPAELSGVYTQEEMEQANNHVEKVVEIPATITKEQISILNQYLDKMDIAGMDRFLDFYKITKLPDLPSEKFEEAHKFLQKKFKEDEEFEIEEVVNENY